MKKYLIVFILVCGLLLGCSDNENIGAIPEDSENEMKPDTDSEENTGSDSEDNSDKDSEREPDSDSESEEDEGEGEGEEGDDQVDVELPNNIRMWEKEGFDFTGIPSEIRNQIGTLYQYPYIGDNDSVILLLGFYGSDLWLGGFNSKTLKLEYQITSQRPEPHMAYGEMREWIATRLFSAAVFNDSIYCIISYTDGEYFMATDACSELVICNSSGVITRQFLKYNGISVAGKILGYSKKIIYINNLNDYSSAYFRDILLYDINKQQFIINCPYSSWDRILEGNDEYHFWDISNAGRYLMVKEYLYANGKWDETIEYYYIIKYDGDDSKAPIYSSELIRHTDTTIEYKVVETTYDGTTIIHFVKCMVVGDELKVEIK